MAKKATEPKAALTPFEQAMNDLNKQAAVLVTMAKTSLFDYYALLNQVSNVSVLYGRVLDLGGEGYLKTARLTLQQNGNGVKTASSEPKKEEVASG